jgi:hypothetical protein
MSTARRQLGMTNNQKGNMVIAEAKARFGNYARYVNGRHPAFNMFHVPGIG